MNGGVITGNEDLTGIDIDGAITYNGGGVFNAGTFIMNDGIINGNEVPVGGGDGGGVYSTGIFTMGGGTISGNESLSGGGVYNTGTFTMDGGTISGNTGGGVSNGGLFTMNGGTISGNEFVGWGGGVAVNDMGSAFAMNGGTISSNESGGGGGGVAITSNSTFTMSDGIIHGNKASVADGGGGVHISGSSTFIMNGGTISGNEATMYDGGGGVYIYDNSTFTMNNGTISGNVTSRWGGGVSVMNAAFTMNGGTISGNEADWLGGGVIITGSTFTNSTFTMNGGTISDNEISSWGGGGVAILDATFTMSDGIISGNKAAMAIGGGVYIMGISALTMDGGVISDNWAVLGGGVYIEGDDLVVNISDTASITGNTAEEDGGGIFVEDRNSLTIDDTVVFNGNIADNGIFNYGLSNGLIAYPQIRWAGYATGTNSVPNSHLLNNYDINNDVDNDDYRIITFFGNSGTIFGLNRHSFVIPYDTIIPNGQIPMPPNVVRSGYIFLGWSAAADSTPITDWDFRVTENRVFYAQWEPAAEVTFNLGGGTVGGNPASIVHLVAIGSPIGLSNVPEPLRASHSFGGWRYVGQASGTSNLTSGAVAEWVVTVDRTFIAQWTPSGGNGGNGSSGGGDTPLPPLPSAHERQAYLIGFEDGLIRPNGNITRAEVATIFFRLITDEARYDYWTQQNPFSDVAPQNWFNNAISTMTNADIFTGLPNGTFAPNQTITRAEMTAVIVRFMDAMEGMHLLEEHFSDISGHWAAGYINAAAVNGWVQGTYGRGDAFYPDRPITRAEAAAMVNRISGRLQERAEDLLPNMRTWPDNANINAWHYFYIQSATHSYTFQWRGADNAFERWLTIIPPRDWAALERPDATPNSIFGAEN
ncbi:MAG: S-layer homology domain-containing protein [Oscillospiraceae bacterium]|nr:S-layer homology domain-containing protein [Oscillospiraceae bacterium]